MKPDTPNMNDAYLAYADLLLKHFRLLSDGKDESAEIEQVEEEMTRLWETLDEAQRRSLKGIGSDLNWLRRSGKLPLRGRTSEEVGHEYQADLKSAQTAKDWHAVLYHLRECAAVMQSENLAATRARCYRLIGLEEIAAVFDDFSAQLRAETVGRIPVGR